MRARPRWAGALLLLVLALLAVGRSALGTAHDSFSIDEPWHIVAGTSYARGEGYHLNPEHPPLVKRWVGHAMPSDFRLRAPRALAGKEGERVWTQETMFEENDAAAAQQRSRAALWALNGLLFWVLGLVLWRALGLAWASGTLTFLLLEPTVAAHMPVVMTDLPLALTLGIAAGCAGLLMATWRWRWAVACGMAFGLALTAKHSALAGLLGIAAVLAVAGAWGLHRAPRLALRRTAQVGAAAVLALGVLWAAYDFRFHADPDGGDRFNQPLQAKIDELRLPHWRQGLDAVHRAQLLPRSYIWGLADTVRSGVEGRSNGMHRIWGRLYEGLPPWFSWPAILLSKVPLALLLLAVAALPLLLRRHLPARARWTLTAVAAAGAFHMAALVGSGGVWGGVRHALPVVVALAVAAGAAVDWAWRSRSRARMALAALPLAVTAAMTLGEPRAWLYHNELVGGTRGAYRYFENEGLGIGQTYGDLLAFYRTVVVPSGEPLYGRFGLDQQLRADRVDVARLAATMDDDNRTGHTKGWMVANINALLPLPQVDWDPARDLKGLTLVARIGNHGIWRGERTDPKNRAGAMMRTIMEYLYRDNGRDWAKVALRLEEVLQELPFAVPASFELGNAYIRLGKREQAIAAYEQIFKQERMPLDPLVATQVRTQIERLRAAGPMPAPMANPWRE